MRYRDLRDFLSQLERAGELKRVRAEVDPKLEITEVCDRVLKAGGPALSTRSQTSVISSFGSTSARTRFSSPARSSCDRKSRKSRYLISLDDRCCSGAVQRDSVPLH